MTLATCDRDETWMGIALSEGQRGLGLTSPNPAVGAVVVKEGQELGRGWHQVAGGPHAEVEAIKAACAAHGAAALHGSTIYVTLEPCSTQGKTPPCTQAIVDAGIARVVVGTVDPNPAHLGGGLAVLRSAGVEVVSPVLEAEAVDLLRFFSKRVTTGLPWVIAKTAMTLDAKTSLPPGWGQWISSELSRDDVQRLRQLCDAVLIGGATMRQDNPALTLRGEWAIGRQQPLRVVLTSQPCLPEGCTLLTDEFADRTRLHSGITLETSLRRLASEGVNAVLLESGGRLLSHALAAGFVDEVVLYVAPYLGGGDSRLLDSSGVLARLDRMEAIQIGPDIRISGRISRDRP